MKAPVCDQFAAIEKLSPEDKPSRAPGKAEMLIDVKAAGIDFPDLLTVQGKYQIKPLLP